MKILGLIPARGGSKGLPGKNLLPLGGVSLLGRTILAARRANVLDRLWVSTDDPKIAAEAEAFGVSVPWLRPKALAQDGSALADALKHLLARLDKDEGYRPDAIMVLQVTSPLRTPETIRKAVALFQKHKGASVISVTPARTHPVWCYRLEGAASVLKPYAPGRRVPPPRQKLPPAYALNGSVYLVSRERFLKTGAFYGARDHGLIVPAEEAVDIDTPFDWEVAQGLWERRNAALAAAPSKRCFVIAEAGVNHNGDLALAKKLVETAKDSGADAVKFQTFCAERLVAKDARKAAYQQRQDGAGTQLDMLKRLELSQDAHRELAAHAARLGLVFLSTPFDEGSADFLDTLGVPLFKLPSGEITNRALLEHVARKGKPIVLSTGMSTLEEVRQAVGWISAVSDAPLTLLHCLSDYPAPPEQANLRAMDTLREAFGLPVGYSDHTPGIEVAVAAAARGAAVIEKHLTLDKTRPGPDHAASLDPAEFKALVAAIRRVESALGDGIKRPAPCELGNRDAARRSLVAARSLEAGATLRREDIAAKRPGTGLSPALADAVVGKRLRRAVQADEPLTWEALA